jgi:predicted ArsR family transcriptional regulator
VQSLKNIDEKRAAMAKQHAVLVEALVEALGREAAVKVGREALFTAGEQLGSRNRQRLGVDSPSDLVKAAKIMYNVLGINFKVEWLGPNQGTLTVDRCALAENYTELTCEVLSATDEGVIHGLNPNMTMKFEKTLTDGCNVCTAKIERKNQK